MNKVLGALRFAYMIPAPKQCTVKLDIQKTPTENSRVHISKELAFCRRNRDKIQKQAQKNYNRVINKENPELTKNSCDFKLLEKAYVHYCIKNNIELPVKMQNSEFIKNVLADLSQPSTHSPTKEKKQFLGKNPVLKTAEYQKKHQEPSVLGVGRDGIRKKKNHLE